MNFLNFFESFVIGFLSKYFFNIVLDYHFVKTTCLGKFLSLICEPKRLSWFFKFSFFLTTWLFELILIDSVMPLGESAECSTPYRSVYRFDSHFITSLKQGKDEKQKKHSRGWYL